MNIKKNYSPLEIEKIDERTHLSIWTNISYNKEIVEDLKENNLLKYYISRFENYFSSIWFKKKQWLELVWNDDTILFTNSAIVSLKKYILNWDKIPSYFIIQPCLRLQNLNSSISEEALYMSSFHMIWAFISAEKYDIFIKQVWNFLLNELEYNIWDLKIYCDKTHTSLINWWDKIENWPEIVYSDEWFDWKFWEWDIMKWNWFSFRVKDHKGNFKDIWNIMEIISDWKVVWYWLGLWVETLISKKRDYINPIQFFTDNSWISIEKNEDIYLYDTLKVLIDTYRRWLKSWRNWSWYEIKKAFNKVNWILASYPEKYINLYEEVSSMERFIYWDIIVSKIIFDELINRWNYKLFLKPFTLLFTTDYSIDNLLDYLTSNFPDMKFGVKDIYEWDNIGIGNKSVTIEMTYVSGKSKSKEFFKNILWKIWEIYKIR